jgi:hypothetical protein
VDYPFNVSTNTTDLDTTKIHFNSVISTPGARFMGLDLKDFYLGTIMKQYEYAKIKLDLIPMEIVTQYHLHEYVDQQGYVNFEIRKGMYGLPQAGRLANEQLQEYLEPFGYTPTKRTPGLWKHKTRPISFVLWVDDFGVKYSDKKDAQHLIDTLKQKYRVSIDWTGSTYVKMKLKWDYDKRTVSISIPGYVKKALLRFGIGTPTKSQDPPHPFTAPVYGRK